MAELVHRGEVNVQAGASSAVVRFIVDQIASGNWRPGYKLPTERTLARQFGVARNTLRRGLDSLEERGVIHRQVGNGTFVLKSVVSNDETTDPSIIKIETASPADIMEFRLTLEPLVAELAVLRASDGDINEMEKILERAEAAFSISDFEFWDGAFHVAIVKSSRNRVMGDVYVAINTVRNHALWGKMKERSLTPVRRHRYEVQHRQILNALRNRDRTDVRDKMSGHLMDVRDSLLEAATIKLS
jgi:DNA-binding FadR family transcriptional regulator